MLQIPHLFKGETVTSRKNDALLVVTRCLTHLPKEINQSILEVLDGRLALP